MWTTCEAGHVSRYLYVMRASVSCLFLVLFEMVIKTLSHFSTVNHHISHCTYISLNEWCVNRIWLRKSIRANLTGIYGSLVTLFNQQPSLYSIVIILVQWRGINGLFVCLNGGFIDVKDPMLSVTKRTREGSLQPTIKKTERLQACGVTHEMSLQSVSVIFQISWKYSHFPAYFGQGHKFLEPISTYTRR